MSLINCPECNHQVSDTAETCPNCGFNIKSQAEFTPVVNPLSETKKIGYVSGIVSALASVALIAIGVFTIAIGFGIILIILGVFGVFVALTKAQKVKYGKCPYCGTDLRVKINNTSFVCPICKNVGNQTDTTLESTHAYNAKEK